MSILRDRSNWLTPVTQPIEPIYPVPMMEELKKLILSRSQLDSSWSASHSKSIDSVFVGLYH
jgi:hypothetical protein